jgi:DNA-directed RNA polymerase specialized sigma24 family protein
VAWKRRSVRFGRLRPQAALGERGGYLQETTLDDSLFRPARSRDLLALDEALAQLAEWDAVKAEIVELRFFGGLSVEDTATALKMSKRTVEREWAFARAWLEREITNGL